MKLSYIQFYIENKGLVDSQLLEKNTEAYLQIFRFFNIKTKVAHLSKSLMEMHCRCNFVCHCHQMKTRHIGTYIHLVIAF